MPIPRHLSFLLQYHDYDSIHTLDLFKGNRTTFQYRFLYCPFSVPI
jgi:hypothetical protein